MDEVSADRPKALPTRRPTVPRRTPLHVDVLDAKGLPCPPDDSGQNRQCKRKYTERSECAQGGADEDDAAGEPIMPSNLSKKLLRLVEEQQRER